jgi:uncharacterized phage protein (TIGR01671 family)
MRDILFRGKRKDSGEWVYGDFASNGCGIVCTDYLNEYGDFGEIYRKVYPETVGQYTGLTDNNGNKIFEGDIVTACGRKGAVTANKFNCGCCYPVYGFAVCEYNEESPSDLIEITDCEVIGNLHDNPELLED